VPTDAWDVDNDPVFKCERTGTSKRDELFLKLFSPEGKPSALDGIKVVEPSISNLVDSTVGPCS